MNPLNIIKSKIIFDREDSFNTLQVWRFKDEKIVFTNGCFDLIHRGHLEYLAQTSALGHRMVIGLNSDASVRRLKGAQRPINDQYSRALQLASLGFVDMVILFEQDTPEELIEFVQPDVLVKGSDYEAKDIVGYDIVTRKGGEIKTIDFIQGYSSSKIIKKIKATD